MIKNMQISGVHTALTPDIEFYVDRKIGLLDRYVPRRARTSLKVEVKIKELKRADKENFTCEVIMKLPAETITVHEKATSVLASIDLAEDTLKIRLKKYKDTHSGPRIHRKLIHSIKRSPWR